jgi:hypothetical protein
MGLLALGLVLAACLATLMALVDNSLACEEPGSDACTRASLAHVALGVSVVGFVPAVGALVGAATGRRRLFAASLISGLVVLLGWALLSDAVVHGWDDLKWF